MSMLMVAAGGGGDAITAALLGQLLDPGGEHAVISYSWDRLIIDPLPGPRGAHEFTGLRQPAPGVHQIVADTHAASPAGSSLPRLAAELPARIFLLDPSHGAIGMATQIAATALHVGADRLGLVDVGGDVLALGGEPELRSPLADLLSLAACWLTGLPCQVLIAGPGVDGELSADLVRARLDESGADHLLTLGSADVEPTAGLFSWHPSEASGLLAAAARGYRGTVEARDAADHILLSDLTPRVFSLPSERLRPTSPARGLSGTVSLAGAADAVRRATGICELDYETRKASQRGGQLGRMLTQTDLHTIDQLSSQVGADFLTVRRLAELTGVRTLEQLHGLHQLLAEHRPARYAPPLYRCE